MVQLLVSVWVSVFCSFSSSTEEFKLQFEFQFRIQFQFDSTLEFMIEPVIWRWEGEQNLIFTKLEFLLKSSCGEHSVHNKLSDLILAILPKNIRVSVHSLSFKGKSRYCILVF